VEIRVADARRRDANEDPVLVRLRNRYLLERERLSEFADDGCFHRVAHLSLLLLRAPITAY
jgi:hypothetical protein